MPTAHERDPIGVQDIIQNISTSIHDDPASIIAPFEILQDEEIMTFSEMQSDLLHTITIVNTLETLL